MTTTVHRSNSAYSAVLAHASYAGIEGVSFETKLAELAKGVRLLCDEYNVNFEEASKLPE